MTQGTSILSDLFRQQNTPKTETDDSALASFYEIVLKILFWTVDHIPYISTCFRNTLSNSMDSASSTPLNNRELTQLSAYPCPSFYTKGQIAHIQDKIAKNYIALMEKVGEAPEYSICYSLLGVVSKELNCIQALSDKVTTFYQKNLSIHLGTTVQENRPTLSLDFINICVKIIPPLSIKELFIHGPIDSEEDLEKLKTIITTTKSLATLHFEVRKTSAIYFTKKATAMLDANRTIIVFNLTLMGKKSALMFDTDPWIPLNGRNGCSLTYTNIEPPSDLVLKNLTFN